ncbi:prepilin-type N-terminal cleavage/methylation domain-containing protein [Pseudoalteromonas citrea]|nr:prepilin-type N-terminal cleavage/methylation domain-containing protein [Pseudoalteromonas citrea]
MKKNKGFSLIELMIATTLLSLVMFSGYYSYSLYSSSWEKRVERFWSGAHSGMMTIRLVELLQGMQPYVIKKRSKQGSFIAFLGEPEQVVFVSNNAFHTTGLAVVRLKLLSSQRSGLQRLTYSEVPLAELSLSSKGLDDITWPQATVIFEQLELGTFSYYGWEDPAMAFKTSGLDSLNSRNDSEYRWFERYDSRELRLSPLKISFQYRKENTLNDSVITLPLYSKPELIISNLKG